MKRIQLFILVLYGVMASLPPPFDTVRGLNHNMISLDLHPTLYHPNATTSAVYPPHAHRRLNDFHRYRHLSRYEQQLRQHNWTWNGEYDQAFFTNQTLHHRSLAGGQLSQYQAVPLSQGYGTHFASLWVGTPTPQRKTVIVDTVRGKVMSLLWNRISTAFISLWIGHHLGKSLHGISLYGTWTIPIVTDLS